MNVINQAGKAPDQLTVDLKCAVYGKQIADVNRDEKVINRAIDILHCHGIYAYFLFLLSEEDKDSGKIKVASEGLLKEYGVIRPEAVVNATSLEQILRPAAISLDKLFFTIELLDKLLIYAKYYQSAMPDKAEKKGKK